jgi:hypothetical protein
MNILGPSPTSVGKEGWVNQILSKDGSRSNLEESLQLNNQFQRIQLRKSKESCLRVLDLMQEILKKNWQLFVSTWVVV